MPARADEAVLMGEVLWYYVHVANSISQKELATDLGVSDVTVSRWVHGKMMPPPGRRRNIEKQLGIRKGSLDRPGELLNELKTDPRVSAVWRMGAAERVRARAAGETPDYSRGRSGSMAVAEMMRPVGSVEAERAGGLDMKEAAVRIAKSLERALRKSELVVDFNRPKELERQRALVWALKDLARQLKRMNYNMDELFDLTDEMAAEIGLPPHPPHREEL